MIFDKDLIGKKQSVVDEFMLLSPHTTPLLSMIGFSEPVYNTTHQWFEDEVIPYEGATTGAVTAAATAITVADVEPFAVGHVVKVGEELVRIDAIDAATKKLTVVRGYADTTASDYVSGAKLEVLFREGEEGADFVKARSKARKAVSNVSQIFSESVELTGSAMEVANYGIADLYENEKQLKQTELALQLEKMLINGVKFDNGVVRQSQGIRSFIKNVADGSGQALSLDHVNDLAQDLYSKGAFANGGQFVLLAGAKQKRAFGQIQEAKIEIPQGSRVRGDIVDGIATDFGNFQIALNQNLAADEVMLVDLNRIKLRPLGERSFSHTYHGVDGDRVKGTVLGEYTLEVKQGSAMGRIKNLG
ncbi:MAG: SU10 major capsid protein [Bacillota bacterium]